jgi:hypothetical protein
LLNSKYISIQARFSRKDIIMNKKAFVVSIALSVIVLMVVGGIAYSVRFANQVQAAIASPAIQALDPALEQSVNEREAAYQKMIAEANARLEQAQQQQLALQDQLAALQSEATVAAPQAELSPEQAATIAADFLGQTSVYSVEMTAIRGISLYKVTFSSGDIIYISLDGQVAGSAVAQQAAFQGPTTPHRGGGEYEGDDDD